MGIESGGLNFQVRSNQAVSAARNGGGLPWSQGKPEIGDLEPIKRDYFGFLRWVYFGLGIVRAVVRLLSLVPILFCAALDAALGRLTTCPTTFALARNRSFWLQRWSRVVCWILGIQVRRRGFGPVSGLIVIQRLTVLDALVLSSLAPCLFVAEMEVSRWPAIGLMARLGGTVFWNRSRRNDLVRIHFMVERALRRRQIVIVSPVCRRLRGAESGSFNAALFQVAVEAPCGLTAAAIRYEGNEDIEERSSFDEDKGPWKMLASLMRGSQLAAVAAFHSPKLHIGSRKQLARQLWNEVQILESLIRG